MNTQEIQLASFRIVYLQDDPLPPHTFSVRPFLKLIFSLYSSRARHKLVIKSPQALVPVTQMHLECSFLLFYTKVMFILDIKVYFL